MKCTKLHIQLLNTDLKNTRTIYVNSEIIMNELHKYIQNLYGLQNYHLWDFEGKDSKHPYIIRENKEIEAYEEEYGSLKEAYPEREILVAENTAIHDCLNEKNKILYYTYDFGANNERKITYKGEGETDLELPFCEKFEGSYILEDEPMFIQEKMINIYIKKDKKAFKDFNENMGYFNNWKEFSDYISYIFDEISPEILTKRMSKNFSDERY